MNKLDQQLIKPNTDNIKEKRKKTVNPNSMVFIENFSI